MPLQSTRSSSFLISFLIMSFASRVGSFLASRSLMPPLHRRQQVLPMLLSTSRPKSVRSTRRLYSTSAPLAVKSLSFQDTPLGSNGTSLLDGLDVYSVPASGDDHPLAVYGIESENPAQLKENSSLRPVLLLHGRTWSSVPVYHLLGGPQHREAGEESRSLMEALLAKGLQPYAMDFRGFGGTAHDETGYVEPRQCVIDAEAVLKWISERHGLVDGDEPPCLFGWSQGAMVAQLLAQSSSSKLISKLILYGSISDPTVRYPRDPLYTLGKPNRTVIQNQYDDAIEDFTVEGTIAPEPARLFAEAALLSDPIKAVWKHTYQFNNCDPARIHIPTLVVAGDQDPYTSLRLQQELFVNLGRGCDRTWSILADSDHAAHLLEGRQRLINIISSFVKNGKQREL
jgi:alpha-beta hydrolase superfamily lysophospholipase